MSAPLWTEGELLKLLLTLGRLINTLNPINRMQCRVTGGGGTKHGQASKLSWSSMSLLNEALPLVETGGSGNG